MKVSQQIVGVNQRLGNSAVANMQGTTRMIFDTVDQPAAPTTSATNTFFQGVSSRNYPKANIATNRFEPGESLAIQGFSVLLIQQRIQICLEQLQPKQILEVAF